MASIDNVNDITPRVQYVASASQTEFDYPFPIFTDADLVVDVDGVTKALATHYTVAGEGADAGGTITFLAGLSGGEIVTIYRDIGIARSTDFQQNGPYSSESFNDDLDRITLVQQELEMKIGRALRFSLTDEVDSADIELSPIANWLGKYIYINANGEPEPATAVSGTTLSQSNVGAVFYPQTAAEAAAGVTPTYYYYPVGDVRRYGANTTPGTTDMTTAIQNAINAAGQGGWGVFGFTEGETYSTGNITLYGSATSIPQFFDGGRAKFIAKAGTTGYLFDIKTPQSGSSHGFRFENAILDGNDICVPWRLYGSQRCVYGNLLLQNSSAEGARFEHESGGNGGIYYNLFYNIVSGASGNTNAGDGFYSDANSGPSNTMQDNTFINCQAQFNLGDGWDMQYGSGLWAGCGAEKNNGYGYNLTNMVEATFTGGFTENNHKGMAGGGASDGTTDISFYIGSGCNGVKVLGGRHIGEVNGTDMFAIGNFFLPGNFVQMPNLLLDERERLRIRSLLPTPRSFTISAIAKGATTTITTSVNHNLQTADIVRFAFSVADDWQTNMEDMATTITVTGETTFTVAVNSSGYNDYTSGGTCKNGAGIAFDGATPPQGGINGAEGWEIQAAGSQVATFNATCASDETGLYLRHNAGGGGTVVERVTVGAADSGGTNYRVLRIPN